MVYPLSEAVIVGQATEADQYNNLRRDAVYLGGDPDSSGTVYDLLAGAGVILTRTGVTEITLSGPLGLMIGGTICRSSGNKTVTIDPAFYTSPQKLYIFAQTDGAGSFDLIIRISPATISGAVMLGRCIWSGSGIIPGTVRTSEPEFLAGAAQGRLTLVSGDPVPEEDIANADTLYYTPYNGNYIDLYCGGSWERFSFAEISLSLSGLSNTNVYDIFIKPDNSGLTLSALSWGTIGPRPAGQLAWKDGVRVRASDHSARYLGTIGLTGNGITADRAGARLVWNYYQQKKRRLYAAYSGSGTITAVTNAWAPYGGTNAPEVQIVAGTAVQCLELTGIGSTVNITDSDAAAGRWACIGICADMVITSPYTGNAPASPVMYGYQRGQQSVKMEDSGKTGKITYTLGVYSTYPFELLGTTFKSSAGACPALYGYIMA